jgi:hypothetical protein
MSALGRPRRVAARLLWAQSCHSSSLEPRVCSASETGPLAGPRSSKGQIADCERLGTANGIVCRDPVGSVRT